MMTLLSTIRKDQLQARKDRDAVKTKLLTTLIGEAAIIGKNDGGRETTDKEVVDVVKKFIKNIDETLKVRENEDLVVERSVLETYLPPQLSDEQLVDIIDRYITDLGIADMRGMGAVMGKLKQNWDGNYDGSRASGFVKERIAKRM